MVSAVCLADVDIACGELKNAGIHLEYVIQEGGTLYVVEDARRMLAELTQKERMNRKYTPNTDSPYREIQWRWKICRFIGAGKERKL